MRNGLPGEFEEHHGTIVMYPFRTDIWRKNAVYMQDYVMQLVRIIAQYESVYFVCSHEYYKKIVRECLENVTVIESEYDDIWSRDIAPTFVYNQGIINCIDWKFNAWGGKKEGAYYPWDNDDKFASYIANYFEIPCKKSQIVLEGGAIISDGNGTIFTTRSVLLNRNRNPFKTKEYIEKSILDATGDKKLVWLNQGLANDETNGHIDNLMAFVNQNELCLAWTDDKTNPNYYRVRSAYQYLTQITNCNGKRYKIHLVPLPPLQYMNEEETIGLEKRIGSLPRNAGDILPASYLNYYLLNGAILVPKFGCKEDEIVKKKFEEIFTGRKVIQVYSREPLLGGGGLHCILHEIPVLKEKV